MLTLHVLSHRQAHPPAPQKAPLPLPPPLAPQEPHQVRSTADFHAKHQHIPRAFDRSVHREAESQELVQFYGIYCADFYACDEYAYYEYDHYEPWRPSWFGW